MASGVYAMQHSTPDETLRYLDYILSQLENVEIGKNYRDGNGGDKDKSDNDGSHFNVCLEKFLTITFSYSLDNKWWSVLDRLTSWCLLKDKLKLIEPLLIKGDKDELVHLNPKILAALVSKIDVFDDTVKSVFSRGGTTERIELLEELIRLESAEVIFRLRKPIYEAFLNFEDGADNTSKLMMKQVVEKLTILLYCRMRTCFMDSLTHSSAYYQKISMHNTSPLFAAILTIWSQKITIP